MCRHDSCAAEAVSIEESLLIYCKPVELYNILRPRALHNVSDSVSHSVPPQIFSRSCHVSNC